MFPSFEREAARYYTEKLRRHGPVPAGVDWNSLESQTLRFEQLLKVCANEQEFSLLDYGCGYGALVEFLERRHARVQYWGFDAAVPMISEARRIHGENDRRHFIDPSSDLPYSDYTVASGVFNVKQDAPVAEWKAYILENIRAMAERCRRGFAFNMLTSYSDPEKMQGRLFYGDPCFFFDYCKTRFSNVALLHDYGLYEFTILVRK